MKQSKLIAKVMLNAKLAVAFLSRLHNHAFPFYVLITPLFNL